MDVFSPQTAYLTLDMMRDVINSGTATSVRNRLKFSSDWAGKTGTGVDFHDAWFVAVNPNVSFGIWNGYDTPKSLKSSGMNYSIRNNYLWADLMNAAYDVNPGLIDPAEGFKMPGGIVRRSFCGISGLLPSDACSKAGLVQTDLFNAKYVPTTVDDSLVEGKYVTIGDKKYLALDSTPAEFAQTGMILNPDYIQKLFGIKTGVQSLIPKKNNSSWSNILLPDDKLQDNGKVPSPLSVSVSGSNITWGNHGENDVIGYRIYANGAKVGSIKTGSALSFTGGNGKYYVTAVDIAGQESAPSNEVLIGPIEEEKPQEPPVTEPGTGTDPGTGEGTGGGAGSNG